MGTFVAMTYMARFLWEIACRDQDIESIDVLPYELVNDFDELVVGDDDDAEWKIDLNIKPILMDNFHRNSTPC